MEDPFAPSGGVGLAVSIEERLLSAAASHRAGRLAESASLCRGVLDEDPENVDALHRLGVIHHQQGHGEHAAERIEHAARLRPHDRSIQVSLAEVSLALGRHERAVEAAAAALRLGADGARLRYLLGVARRGLAHREPAIEALHRAVALAPGFAAAHNLLGDLLREQGRLDEAAEHFRRVVELEPADAAWRTNLGLVLLGLGRAEEALPQFEAAVRLRPDRAVFLDNFGSALRAAARLDEARRAYLEAIRLDPALAVAYANLGLVELQEGRTDDARRLLARAAGLEPRRAIYWEYLAELNGRIEQYEEAIPCWERVLALTPDHRARPHLALGRALQEMHRLDAAEAHYRAAARIEPDSAEPLIDLGVLHAERGAFDEAEASFRAAIALRPGESSALVKLATLLGGRLPDADVASVQERIDDPTTGEERRARLLFALGLVLDGRGEYAGAAGCAREANALTLSLARGRRLFRPDEYEQFIDDLILAFDADFFARTAGAGNDSRRPVFVVGLPRTGTTLLEQVLAAHPGVHGAGELLLGRWTFESLPGIVDPGATSAECVRRLDAATIRRLARSYLIRLRAFAGDGAARVVDKMPENYLYLGLIATLFPDATVVHCRRDLRDVAVSCWMADFRSLFWANDPGHIAVNFRSYLRLMDHWRAHLPTTLIEVDYEETVANLEGVARRVLARLGLDWDPACLEFHRTRRPVRSSSLTQVRQPLYDRSVARWKRYEHEMADLFAALPVAMTQTSGGAPIEIHK